MGRWIICRASCSPPLIPHYMTRRAGMKIKPYYWETKKNRITARLPFKPPNKTSYRNGAKRDSPLVISGPCQLNRSSKQDLSPRETPLFPPSLLLLIVVIIIIDESVYLWLALLPACRNPRRISFPCWVRPPVIGSSSQAVALSVHAAAAGYHPSRTI